MKHLVLASAAVAGLTAACSASYMLTEYSDVAGTKVTVRCGQRYTVFRRPDDDKLLVLAYPIAELVHCDEDTRGRTGVRYEEAVIAYLEPTPECTIAGGREIDLLHSEFTLSCPKPVPPGGKPKP